MNLDFSSIQIQGFKTFAKKQTLTLGYAEPGVTFIGGRNDLEPSLGANDCGKSTIFDALTWCIYGRTISNLRNTDIAPWENTEPTIVEVKFRLNKLHAIRRELKPNRLLLDGKETSQEDIERLLPISLAVFSHTILLGQGQPLFFDLPPKDKLELFCDTLNLERWDDRSWNAGQQTLVLNNEVSGLKGELIAEDANRAQLNDMLKAAKTRAEDWDCERKTKAKASKEEIAKLQTALDAAQKRRDAADLAIDGALTELKALQKQIDARNDDLLKAQSTFSKEELQIKAHKREHQRLSEELAAFGETNDCPICGQPLKGTNLAKHKAELTKKIADLAKTIKLGVPIKASHAVEVARSELDKTRAHAANFDQKADKARSEFDQVADRVVALETKISELKRVLTESADEINPHRAQVQALRKSIQTVEIQIEEIELSISMKSKKMERSKLWIKGFKDLRLYVIEEILHQLELATNTLLPESGLHNWKVLYDVEKETKSGSVQRGLNTTIISPYNDKPVKWESWGGGVGQRLRLVGALALSEVLLDHAGLQPNLEILDEPTRHLSPEGVQDLCEFLALRAQELNKNIFLIDHTTVESTSFSDTITIIKDKAGSRIET